MYIYVPLFILFFEKILLFCTHIIPVHEIPRLTCAFVQQGGKKSKLKKKGIVFGGSFLRNGKYVILSLMAQKTVLVDGKYLKRNSTYVEVDAWRGGAPKNGCRTQYPSRKVNFNKKLDQTSYPGCQCTVT